MTSRTRMARHLVAFLGLSSMFFAPVLGPCLRTMGVVVSRVRSSPIMCVCVGVGGAWSLSRMVRCERVTGLPQCFCLECLTAVSIGLAVWKMTPQSPDLPSPSELTRTLARRRTATREGGSTDRGFFTRQGRLRFMLCSRDVFRLPFPKDRFIHPE